MNDIAVPGNVPKGNIVPLDVRDDLRNGREPFSRIMAVVGSLKEHDVLHLRATFEPVPLFKALGKRGFEHSSVSHAADDWSVWFYHSDAPAGASAPAAAPVPDNKPALAETEDLLDVRGLEPPEPMTRTLEALEKMPDGHTLMHVNVRIPQFLLPILHERGYEYTVDDTDPEQVKVRIWRKK